MEPILCFTNFKHAYQFQILDEEQILIFCKTDIENEEKSEILYFKKEMDDDLDDVSVLIQRCEIHKDARGTTF